ncbi:hypothetical protein [Streptomyces sp. NPDC001108]
MTIDSTTVTEQLGVNLDQAHEYRRHLAAETDGVMQEADAN